MPTRSRKPNLTPQIFSISLTNIIQSRLYFLSLAYIFVVLVAEVESPEQMDAIAFGLPLMKEIGNQVQVDVTPVTEYHNFANFLETATGEKVSPPAGQVPIDSTKEGIFYWLTIQIGYSGIVCLCLSIVSNS